MYKRQDKNGVIEITVASINGMVAAAYEPVDILDELPPSINEDFTIEDNVLTFTIEDSQSGVDFNSISGTTAMGAVSYTHLMAFTNQYASPTRKIHIEATDTSMVYFASILARRALGRAKANGQIIIAQAWAVIIFLASSADVYKRQHLLIALSVTWILSASCFWVIFFSFLSITKKEPSCFASNFSTSFCL